MHHHINLILGMFVIFLYEIQSCHQCIISSQLDPLCKLEENNFVTCADIKDISMLNRILSSVKGCNINLELRNLALQKLPRGLFNGSVIGSLVFKNFSLLQLTDKEPGPSPFLGLERSLHTLGIVGALKSSQFWDWKELSGLHSLETLSIGRGFLTMVPRAFSLINNSSLTRLQMTGSCIYAIEDYALSAFHQLITLNLEANKLMSITRVAFPAFAPKLKYINLRYNLLVILEENIFSNMPALTNIYLDGNRFKVIREAVFGSIWNQLVYLLFYGNPIHCDCNISWILNKKVIYIKNDQPLHCYTPTNLIGADIRYLQKEIICSSKEDSVMTKQKKQMDI